MRTRKFIPLAFLLMLLFSPIELPSLAFAQFCGCGNCWMMYAYYPPPCYCGGGYPTCSTDDVDVSQLTAMHSTDLRSSFIPKSDFNEQVMVLMNRGKCFRARAALSLLGHARDRFVPISFEERLPKQNYTF